VLVFVLQQRKVSGGVTGADKEKEILLEAERLEIKEKAPMVLAELLFDINMAQQIKQYRSLFRRVSLLRCTDVLTSIIITVW